MPALAQIQLFVTLTKGDRRGPFLMERGTDGTKGPEEQIACALAYLVQQQAFCLHAMTENGAFDETNASLFLVSRIACVEAEYLGSKAQILIV